MTPDPGPSRGRLLLVGPGSMGLSLAVALARTGEFQDIQVRGRSARRPSFLDDHPRISYSDALGVEPAATATGTLIVFCLPESALQAAAGDWAAAIGRGEMSERERDIVALHVSGARSAVPLDDLRDLGVATGVWHPLVAVAGPDPDAVRNVTFGLAGDLEAIRAARGLSSALDGRSIEIAPGEHGRYHAAAVFASNFLVACLGVGLEELGTACRDPVSERDLLPLARSALENIDARDVRAGATGPVARGETEIVERHLRALEPERRELYLRLAAELLSLVEDRLEPGRVAELGAVTDRIEESVKT